MSVLVDTNVILDLVTDDPRWAEWSESKLDEYKHEPCLINEIIFTELCVGAENLDEVLQLTGELHLKTEPLTPVALYIAAKAFKKYRAQSGQKDSPLPDFYIGAQAEDLKIPILTRDPTRFRYYFPSVECIAP